jgi:hypothetical protein
MSFKPHLRLPRRRQQLLKLESGDHTWSILHPGPDDSVVIAEFADAVMLTMEVFDLPVRHEALVLLDERRRISAIMLDPPAEVGLLIGMVQLPGVEAPFCQTISIVVDEHVPAGPPADVDRRGYHALRRAHMAQGLLLLDVLLTDGNSVRSLALGCDPDPVWYDEFPTIVADD